MNVMRKENYEKVILDLDGTMYRFALVDPQGESGFKNSILRKKVHENSKNIMGLLGIYNPSAELERATNDSVGISRYLERAYGISRQDYFDQAWNIEPEGIVERYPELYETISVFSDLSGNDLVLLTAAPRVWAKNVLSYLGVEQCFRQLITGETFTTKNEAFEMLYREGGRQLSIGDQLDTDVDSARRVGLDAVLVSGPEETNSVIRSLI